MEDQSMKAKDGGYKYLIYLTKHGKICTTKREDTNTEAEGSRQALNVMA